MHGPSYIEKYVQNSLWNIKYTPSNQDTMFTATELMLFMTCWLRYVCANFLNTSKLPVYIASVCVCVHGMTENVSMQCWACNGQLIMGSINSWTLTLVAMETAVCYVVATQLRYFSLCKSDTPACITLSPLPLPLLSLLSPSLSLPLSLQPPYRSSWCPQHQSCQHCGWN